MAGFFGLFNSKTKYVDEPNEDNSEDGSLEFFLEPDEAKSLGNTKSQSQEGGEIIQEVSSLDKGNISEAKTPSSPKVKTTKPTESANPERRLPDDSMELFRNMARGMKK